MYAASRLQELPPLTAVHRGDLSDPALFVATLPNPKILQINTEAVNAL